MIPLRVQATIWEVRVKFPSSEKRPGCGDNNTPSVFSSQGRNEKERGFKARENKAGSDNKFRFQAHDWRQRVVTDHRSCHEDRLTEPQHHNIFSGARGLIRPSSSSPSHCQPLPGNMSDSPDVATARPAGPLHLKIRVKFPQVRLIMRIQ